MLELLETRSHNGLVLAGRRLLQALAPGAQVQLVDAATPAPPDSSRVILLPLGRHANQKVQAQLPEGMSTEEFKRRIGLVASLLGARDDQLHAMRRLTSNVRRTERAERLQRTLYAITELASSERELPSILRSMHHIIGNLMYAENFFIVFTTADEQALRFAYFADRADPDPPLPEREYPLREFEHSPTWYVLKTGRVLMGTMDEVAAQVNGPVRAVGPNCNHWLGVPLHRGEHTIGALVVQSYRDKVLYSDADKALLSYVAQHVQTALERHQLHQNLSRRVAERTRALEEANQSLKQQVAERQRGERLQAALFRIAELAGNNSSLEAFYRDLHQVVSGLLDARNFYIAILSDDRGTLEFPYSVDEFDDNRTPRQYGRGLTEYVLEHGTALLSDSANTTKLQHEGLLHRTGVPAVCWLGVPLVIQGHTVGVLAVQSYSDERRYGARDKDLLTFVSYHIGNALERKRNADSLKQANAELEQRVLSRTRALAEANQHLRQQILKSERIEQRLKYQTLHDSLTGLPNRSLLLRRMNTALQASAADPTVEFAVLFLDLDRFKVINDSVGHLVGDDLLFQAGERIRACLKGQDMVARLGGDEFAVLLEHVNSVAEAQRIAERIIGELNRPFHLGAKELYTTSSIGIVMGAPHYRHAEELLRDADTAMYRAKDNGRQRYVIFDEDMRRQATHLQEIENDLRRAVTRHEFEPYFQPIVQMRNGAVIGYEALVRWNHPERGILLPKSFLRVAQDSGLDERIDWIMFDLVLAVASRLACGNRFVSINLSARHFRSAHKLHERILAQLRRHRVAPTQIRIEITENVLLDNQRQVHDTLLKLRDAGIGVALDDFGTGYSSLSYLHRFPLNTLKIDQSFVSNLLGEQGNSIPVVRAIKSLADSQNMQVIAEGVESGGQATVLQQLGCEFGQGFLYATPQPAEAWLATA